MRTIEEIHHLITTTEPRDISAWGLLAAGPLQDLLVRHGEAVVNQVEALARDDAEFRKLLAGVLKSSMSDEIHIRVQKVTDPQYKFV
jgi:hypothetical protein